MTYIHWNSLLFAYQLSEITEKVALLPLLNMTSRKNEIRANKYDGLVLTIMFLID
jgi:hypothetical protein